ncbi:hypothetical protein TRVL_02050 [Trypanosoma vivax]|uniref:Uncharacterized protein n=1 Tax=Trypanosoma vivax (strain Y486) TaxID=1055687 RepID=G0U2S2_TRYVY|nr:hypothetical protein TRVL_02050 [Trypanosoma vivax]CCC50576.1 hypothetical protein TVY486_0903970 [Trypanosoma vivax Y486]
MCGVSLPDVVLRLAAAVLIVLVPHFRTTPLHPSIFKLVMMPLTVTLVSPLTRVWSCYVSSPCVVCGAPFHQATTFPHPPLSLLTFDFGFTFLSHIHTYTLLDVSARTTTAFLLLYLISSLLLVWILLSFVFTVPLGLSVVVCRISL